MFDIDTRNHGVRDSQTSTYFHPNEHIYTLLHHNELM